MLKFITHRPLWVNILAGIILAVLILLIFVVSLNWLTHHGSARNVPSVTGKSYEEAKMILKKAGFDIEIQDSIYSDTAKPMTVLKQTPDGDEVVKINRTVYLTITRSVPPVIEMPNLVGFSFRNAEMTLLNSGLKLGDTLFKPDFARNAVLEQLYEGNPIMPGTKIRMGSKISFVLGDGVGNLEFAVPVIVGMTFCEAKEKLEANGLGIGAIVLGSGVTDTCSAYIYKQKPERFDEEKRIQHIRSGQLLDVWLQSEKPVIDTLTVDVPSPDNN